MPELSSPSRLSRPTFHHGDIYNGFAVTYWKPVPGRQLGMIESYRHSHATELASPDFMQSARRIAEVVRISPVLADIYRYFNIRVVQQNEKSGHVHTTAVFPHAADLLTRYDHTMQRIGELPGRFALYSGGHYPALTGIAHLAQHRQFLLAGDAEQPELAHDLLVHASAIIPLPEDAIDPLQAYANDAGQGKSNPEDCMYGLDNGLASVSLGKLIAQATIEQAAPARTRAWQHVAKHICTIPEPSIHPPASLAATFEQRIRSLYSAVQAPLSSANEHFI